MLAHRLGLVPLNINTHPYPLTPRFLIALTPLPSPLSHPKDEVLAHRLGLVPLNINPDLLDWKGPEDLASEKNTVVLRLKVACWKDATGALVDDAGALRLTRV